MTEMAEGPKIAISAEMEPGEQALPTRSEFGKAFASVQRSLIERQREGELSMEYHPTLWSLSCAAEAGRRHGEKKCFYYTEGDQAGDWQLMIPAGEEWQGHKEENDRVIQGSTLETMPALMLAVEELEPDYATLKEDLETLKAGIQVVVPGEGEAAESKVISYNEWRQLVDQKAVEISGAADKVEFDGLPNDKKRRTLLEAEAKINARFRTIVVADKAELGKKPQPAESAAETEDPFKEVDGVLRDEARRLFEKKKYAELLEMIPGVAGKSAKAKKIALEAMQRRTKDPEQKAKLSKLIEDLTEQAKPEEKPLLTPQEEEKFLADQFRKLYETEPELAVFLSLQYRRNEVLKHIALLRDKGYNDVQIKGAVKEYLAESASLEAKVTEVFGELNPFDSKDLLKIVVLDESDKNIARAQEATKKFEETLAKRLKEKTPFGKKLKSFAKLFGILLFVAPLPLKLVTEEESAGHQ